MRGLIVGGGSVGKRHLRNFRSLGVTAFDVVDPREDRRRESAAEGGVLGTFAHIEDAIDRPHDFAVICAPTARHTEAARRCVRAGVHVLMEKPIADRPDGVEAVLGEARARNLVYMVGYTYRFWPPLMKLKQLLDDGAIGTPIFADLRFSQYLPDWHPWEDYRGWFMSSREEGGGALLDESHAVDLVRWFLGDVAEVYCEIGNLSPLEMSADDCADLLLRFASGTRASVHLDVFARVPQRNVQVHGTTGSIHCDVTSGELHVTAVEARTEERFAFRGERNDMFVAEARHFLACLRREAEPCVSGEDALATLSVLMAARRSSESGTRVRLA